MRGLAIVLAVICLSAIPEGRADSLTEAVQQTLKDQGFYYGEVTGKKDAETTAAIRRYQIRNGLKITGEINAETQKSLGIKGNGPTARATPPPARTTPPRSTADLGDDEEAVQPAPPPREQTLRPLPSPSSPPPDHAPDPYELAPGTSGLFDATPYEDAPPALRRRVIVGAQSMLAHQGYYRSDVDGLFGPEMEFALRAYQTRFGIEPSGRLDKQTLAALGLLPGQRAPGITAPRRPFWQRPGIFAPRGERVYTPR